MDLFQVKVRRLHSLSRIPTKAFHCDSGYDLYASESNLIGPGEAAAIGTGIALELPPGTEGQIRPRSGLARDFLVTVLNTPGTIDEGYRGEIKVLLINHGPQPFRVLQGSRIAQLIIQRRLETEVVEVAEVTTTARGDRGFGSTGQ